MAASAYIDPAVDPLGPLTATDIETVYCKPAGQFGRNRVRKGLYAKGFPHPFERGLWSAKTVIRLASERTQGGVHESRVSKRAIDSLCSSLCRSQQSGSETLASLKQTSLGKWRARRDSNS